MHSDCNCFCYIVNAFCLPVLLKIKPGVYYAISSRSAVYGCAGAGQCVPHCTTGRIVPWISTHQASLPRNTAVMDKMFSRCVSTDFRGKFICLASQKDCRFIYYMAGEMLAVLQEWTQPCWPQLWWDSELSDQHHPCHSGWWA